MVALEIGRKALEEEFIAGAMRHVFHNGKRWGRYLPNLTKDLKRLQVLYKRSGNDWEIPIQGSGKYNEIATSASVSGWNGQKLTDLVAFHGNDFLEVIAILEYWGLWGHVDEILKLVPSKH